MAGPSERRLVRPRVVERETGAVVLLTDVIEERLARPQPSRLCLLGGPGSGRRTALTYLRQHFADELAFGIVERHATVGATTHVTIVPPGGKVELLQLAPWTRDEWIEYLLLRHPAACAHVLTRLHAAPAVEVVLATPRVAVLLLDFLATQEKADLRQALDHALLGLAPEPLTLEHCAEQALELRHTLRTSAWEVLLEALPGTPLAAFRPLFEELVLLGLRRALESNRLEHLCGPLPRGALGLDPSLWSRAAESLERCVCAEPDELQASAATLLHRLGRLAHCWTKCAPPAGARLARADLAELHIEGLSLPGAVLSEVQLRRARLPHAHLTGADLEHAQLTGAALHRADLDGVRAEGADFRAATLRSASLRGARLEGACFAEAKLDLADFGAADLTGCDLRGASLRSARFDQAVLAGIDLRTSALDRALFRGANLHGANLEGCRIQFVDFTGADLSRALFSGSRLRAARLAQANLYGAGLAEVDWEGADLRGADLSHASFHFGSTRAGVLPSAPPSFGTRTGFYGDDLREIDQRAPEELRRANLRGVELRGAHVLDTDFYLVDLRDARFTPEQESHLRATGALLGDTHATG